MGAGEVAAGPVPARTVSGSTGAAGTLSIGTEAGFDLDHADSLHLLRRQTSVLELIAAGTPLAEVLNCVAVALEELIEGSRCSILLFDPATATLHHGAAPSLPAAYSARIDGLLVGPEEGSCGAAAYLGTPVVAADILLDARWRRFRDVATPHGMRSCWSTPIQGRTGIVGTFAVYHDHPHHPPLRERRLVDRFTHLASVAIDHAGLFGALAESEDRFRRAFADNAVGMVLASVDGRIVRVNRALRDLLGRTEPELLGRVLDEFVSPAAGPGLLARLAREPTGPAHDEAAHYEPAHHEAVHYEAAHYEPAHYEAVHYEAVARHAGGRTIDLAVAASVVSGADGVPVNLSVNLLDITQRRAAERERRARLDAEVARAAAESASQAKSEFVAALNHELRTPLQAITGFTELLRTLDLPPDRRQEALGHIGAATEHVLSMVDDLLDVAKIEAGSLPVQAEPVELSGLLAEVLALLAPLAAEQDVTLRSPVRASPVLADTVLADTVLADTVLADTVLAEPGMVRADRRRLRQVLINLVTNGVRYNRPGGWVEVGAVSSGTGGPRVVSPGVVSPGVVSPPEARASGRADPEAGDSGAATVTVTVRDSGCGIPAEMMGRLFTPFDRLGAEGAAKPGAGLGLVVARALTQAMGGTLEIRSAAEAGTTAEITLPAACVSRLRSGG